MKGSSVAVSHPDDGNNLNNNRNNNSYNNKNYSRVIIISTINYVFYF
jgi:hypothetical protein